MSIDPSMNHMECYVGFECLSTVRADKIRVTIEDPRPTAHIQVEAAVKVTYAPDNVEKSWEQNTQVRCTTHLTT